MHERRVHLQPSEKGSQTEVKERKECSNGKHTVNTVPCPASPGTNSIMVTEHLQANGLDQALIFLTALWTLVSLIDIIFIYVAKSK